MREIVNFLYGYSPWKPVHASVYGHTQCTYWYHYLDSVLLKKKEKENTKQKEYRKVAGLVRHNLQGVREMCDCSI